MEGSDTPVEQEAWAEARTCPSLDPLWLRARGLRGGQRGLRTTDSLPGTSHIAAPRRTPVGKAELSHGRGVDRRGWSPWWVRTAVGLVVFGRQRCQTQSIVCGFIFLSKHVISSV